MGPVHTQEQRIINRHKYQEVAITGYHFWFCLQKCVNYKKYVLKQNLVYANLLFLLHNLIYIKTQ